MNESHVVAGSNFLNEFYLVEFQCIAGCVQAFNGNKTLNFLWSETHTLKGLTM